MPGPDLEPRQKRREATGSPPPITHKRKGKPEKKKIQKPKIKEVTDSAAPENPNNSAGRAFPVCLNPQERNRMGAIKRMRI